MTSGFLEVVKCVEVAGKMKNQLKIVCPSDRDIANFMYKFIDRGGTHQSYMYLQSESELATTK